MLNAALVPANNAFLTGGSVTTPAANATIVSTTVANAGIYTVTVSYCLTGTAETQLSNGRFAVNGSAVTAVLPTISASGWVSFTITRSLAAGDVVKFTPTATATTGAIYNAVMATQQIG